MVSESLGKHARQSLMRKLVDPYDWRNGEDGPGALDTADGGLAKPSYSSGVNSKVGTKDELSEDGEAGT